jgi:hypothetical protein
MSRALLARDHTKTLCLDGKESLFQTQKHHKTLVKI